mmetsp:Transcript_50245/g.45029  ORF Transcript_50245/g.45029 Transcript_50245/m.45029 type:complete len:595 (-) Transcript_50245:218-2002(-)
MASIIRKAKNVVANPKESTIEISKDLDRKRLGSSNLTLRQKTLLFVICTTYITAVPLRQFLSSINPDLKTDKNLNFTNELAGVMYVIAGLGYSVGKLLDGIFIDKFGPIKCFILFQIVTVLGVMIFTFLDDVYHFSIILCINAFVQAGLWPSLSKLIYEMYSPAQFCLAFACLGISSRLGSAYSKAIIGYLLYLEFSWRSAIRIIACLGLFGLIWFILWVSFYLKQSDRVAFAYPQYNQIKQVLNKGDHSQQERVKSEVSRQLEVDPQPINDNNNNNNGDNNIDVIPELEESHDIYQSPHDQHNLNSLRHEVRYNEQTIFNQETLCEKLIRFFTNRRFLLICLSNMFITMVVGLDAFSELLLSDVMKPSEPYLDTGIYVMVASSFPLGLTVALLVSYVFLRDKQRYWLANYVNISLLVAVLFCMALLGWTWIMEMFGCISVFTCLSSVALLLFSYGFLLAYPYYIQTGVFALRFGGNDSGLVACLIDFCGYLPSSFLLIVGAWMSAYGWRYVFVLTIVNVCLAAVSFMYFNHYDVIHERKEQLILMNMVQSDVNLRSLDEIVPSDIVDGSNLGLINRRNRIESDSSDNEQHSDQ